MSERRPSTLLLIIAGAVALGVAVYLQVRGKSVGITFVAAGTVLVIAYAVHAFSDRGE